MEGFTNKKVKKLQTDETWNIRRWAARYDDVPRSKTPQISTFIFTDAEDSPATKFSDEHIIAQYDDFEKLERFIMACDVVTYEFENIPYKTLNHILKKKPVYPDPQINNIIQDRLTEKKFINDLNIPTVPYLPIEESNQSNLRGKFFQQF